MDQGENSLDNKEEQHFRQLLKVLDLENRQDGKYYDWILFFKSQTKIQSGKIASLDLSWLELQTLPANFLKDFKHLTSLRLDSNPNIEFEDGCFDFTPNLQELKLRFCNLSEFPKNAFTSHSTLKELEISNNPIKIMKRGAFQNLSNIEKLEISDTQIVELQPYCFDGLSHLTSLSLNDNDLDLIPSNSFQGLVSLTTLDLRNNDIHKIEAKALAGLNNLIEIRLDNNDLNTLPTTLFSYVPQIECISLVNNKLSLLSRIFTNLNNLTRLDLDTNLIEKITQLNFSNSPKLKHILLQSNLIRDIELNAFEGLHSLELINIQNNPLNGEEVLQLPPQALFNYHPLINQLTSDEIYKFVVRYHTNTRFVDQVLQSDKITDKTIAFLRLLGYESN
ncbi:MAG: leucine-rich repeat domain-containing protein [Candidatus Kariarchaeaceae archaeon]|jgi:Leucine-rich repeat (LRR) protein